MPTSLITLPQEMLLRIIGHVQEQGALYNLSQCCRLTYDLALPELYHSVEIWQTRYVNPALHFHRLYHFTCQILRSYERASLVRNFTFREVLRADWPEIGNSPTGLVRREKVDENLQRAVRRVRYSIADERGWLRDLHSTNPVDALLVLLLPSLPSLESLNMALPHNHRYYSRMLTGIVERRGKAFSSTAFERLQHVVVPFSHQAGERRATGLWPHQLAYLLRLPSIQSVSARVCDEEEGEMIFGHDDTDGESSNRHGSTILPSSATTLALEGSFLHCSDVEFAVRTCTSLRSLKLRWLYHRGSDAETANRHIAAIPAAIMPASQTLESLSLTYDLWRAASMMVESEHIGNQCRISLTDFARLRNLTLGMVFIFGLPTLDGLDHRLLAQMLPPDIETLQIEQINRENVAPTLTNVNTVLMEKQSGRFPRLKAITVVFHRPGLIGCGIVVGRDDAALPLEIRWLAARIGVDFRRVDPETDPADDTGRSSSDEEFSE